MVILALMVSGVTGVIVGWRLVAAGRVSVWVGQGALFGVLGVLSLGTGRVPLSPKVWWGWALLAGAGSGVALYLATVSFVWLIRRWRVFERHIAEIYDQRKGLSLPVALAVAALLVSPGEELFWRGLFQPRLAEAAGWAGGSVLTWLVYVVANVASGSLPIVAAAVVSGAVWGALALWTHGVVASMACHMAWTGLMLAAPPPRP